MSPHIPDSNIHATGYRIGGVTFNVRHPELAAIPADKILEGFAVDSDTLARPPDVQVTISRALSPFAEPPPEKRLYESGSSWDLYCDGEDYRIVLRTGDAAPPLWQAEATAGFTEVLVKTYPPAPGKEETEGRCYPFRYPLDQILLMHYLGSREGVIIHCAGVEHRDQILLFAGRSGAGKTTLTSCLTGDNRFRVLSDDRMIIRRRGEQFHGYGTPWPGEGRMAVNRGGVLGGICFLAKSPANRLVRIPSGEAFTRLMPVLSIPWYHREMVDNLVGLSERLVRTVPVYVLHFSPSVAIADVLAASLGE